MPRRFTQRLLEPAEQFELLDDGVGVTNAAARTTPGSGDLRKSDFAGAAERLEGIAEELNPAWIGFVGKEAYRGVFRRPSRARRAGARVRRHASVRPAVDVAGERSRAAGTSGCAGSSELAKSSEPIPRPGVRALMFDADDRVLLFRYPTRHRPGRVGRPGWRVSSPASSRGSTTRASSRKRRICATVELGPWIWTRRHVWAWRGTVYDTRERFAVVRVNSEDRPSRLRVTHCSSAVRGPASNIAGGPSPSWRRRRTASLRGGSPHCCADLLHTGAPAEPLTSTSKRLAAPAVRDRRAAVAAERLRPQLHSGRRLPSLVLGTVDHRHRALDDVAVEAVV